MDAWAQVKKAIYQLFFMKEDKPKLRVIENDRPSSGTVCGTLIGKSAEITQWTLSAIDVANRHCNESHRATALEALYAGILHSAMLIADELPPENLDAVIRALEPAKTPEGTLLC